MKYIIGKILQYVTFKKAMAELDRARTTRHEEIAWKAWQKRRREIGQAWGVWD